MFRYIGNAHAAGASDRVSPWSPDHLWGSESGFSDSAQEFGSGKIRQGGRPRVGQCIGAGRNPGDPERLNTTYWVFQNVVLSPEPPFWEIPLGRPDQPLPWIARGLREHRESASGTIFIRFPDLRFPAGGPECPRSVPQNSRKPA